MLDLTGGCDTSTPDLQRLRLGLIEALLPQSDLDQIFEDLGKVLGEHAFPDDDEVAQLLLRLRGTLMQLPIVVRHRKDLHDDETAALVRQAQDLREQEAPDDYMGPRVLLRRMAQAAVGLLDRIQPIPAADPPLPPAPLPLPSPLPAPLTDFRPLKELSTVVSDPAIRAQQYTVGKAEIVPLVESVLDWDLSSRDRKQPAAEIVEDSLDRLALHVEVLSRDLAKRIVLPQAEPLRRRAEVTLSEARRRLHARTGAGAAMRAQNLARMVRALNTLNDEAETPVRLCAPSTAHRGPSPAERRWP